MPVAGTRVTLATMLGAADALVVESVEEDVAVLSEGPGLHPGAKASTRTYDGERVWHLTFVVLERHEITPGQARVELCLHDRHLLGEERRLPRVACRLAATARPRRRPARVRLGQGARRLAGRARAAHRSSYGAGDLIDVELDDGTGSVISARVEVVDLVADEAGGIARGRIVAVADDGAQRLGALVDRLQDSPSDADTLPEPLPALRAALAAARRLRG